VTLHLIVCLTLYFHIFRRKPAINRLD